ncbi:MAG TPA: hypothetical protein VF852_14755, partial [Pseudolabrys sp.]
FTITFGIICNTSQQAELTFEAGSGGFAGYGSVSIGDILPRLVLLGDLVLGDRFPKPHVKITRRPEELASRWQLGRWLCSVQKQS